MRRAHFGRGGQGSEGVSDGAGRRSFDEALEAEEVFDFGIAAWDDGLKLKGGRKCFEEFEAKSIGICLDGGKAFTRRKRA